MENGLEIFTLGGVRILRAGEPVVGLTTRKAEALLIYLASTRRPHPREVLAELLWDERTQSQSMGNLRVVLTSLRQQLGEYLTITRESVGLDPSAPVWMDSVELEEHLEGVRKLGGVNGDAALQVSKALELYRGDFLAGFSVYDCWGFEGWVVRERERLHRLAVDGLSALVEDAIERRDYQVGMAHATRLLELDPLMERAHRQMMVLLAQSGQRAAALNQYETCLKLLKTELQVEPSVETRQLYEQIRAGKSGARAEPVQLPGGTVTFLFTDIGGSTERLKNLREQDAVVRNEPRKLLLAVFQKWRGHLIDQLDDSFFVAFERTTDAIACAVEAQQSLARHAGPEEASVQVRMGLHTGEPWTSEDGYVGSGVHQAARIAYVAHGGQVLLSETTTALVKDDLPIGVSLRDLGRHLLKDIHRPEHICQLVIEGLQAEFPPLTSLETLPPEGTRISRQVGECPYRGLAAFREADAAFYFGRERFIDALEHAVRTRKLVAVIVGSSGSGKSSALFAGLLPRLRKDGGSLFAIFRPGSQPFYSMAGALLPLLEPDLSETDHLVETRKLAEALTKGEVSLAQVAGRILKKSPQASRIQLLIDQFEELYTLCPEVRLQEAFIDELLATVEAARTQVDGSAAFLLTLRADFMGQALSHRPFADALQEASLLMGPMTRQELHQAIEKPAEMQGAAFEAGLVERILDDVGEKPGNLPLLEFTLTQLWERQTDGWLTHADYEAMGCVEGALAAYADQVYADLDPNEQERARQALVQLVQPGEGTEDTRRIATHEELGDESWSLIQRLADRRLVVTGLDARGRETAEVVHEALIQKWGLFREWMDADRAFRKWQERLRSSLRQWQESGQDEGALLAGAPLAIAQNWLAERGDGLSSAEVQYIQESEARQLRKQMELRRRRQWTFAGLTAGLVFALILSLLAGQQWQRAQGEELKALRQASIGLASQALAEIDGSYPERAIPLALETLEDFPYTWQAEKALGQAVLEHRLQLFLTALNADIYAVAWSPDGTRIAATSSEGTSMVWDGRTGERLATLSGHEAVVFGLSWSPSGEAIATGSDDGTARIWDAATGEERFTLSGHGGPVNAVVWSPSGDRIVTVSSDATARVWDTATGKELIELAHEAPTIAAGWSPLGNRVAVGDLSGEVILWDGETGEQILSLHGHAGAVNDVSWAPSADRIATASDDHTARVWDASTGEALQVLTGHEYEVWRARWSPAGDRIVTTALDASTQVWDPATGEAVLSFDPGDGIHLYADVDWSPSADQVATIRSSLGSLTVLDVETGVQVLTLAGHMGKVTSVDWSPTEPLIATASEDKTVRVWDVAPRARVLTGLEDVVTAVAWSPSGDRLAAASFDGTARVWDAASGEELLVLRGPAAMGGVMWSSSGDLLVTDPWDADPTVVVWDVSPSSPTYGEELFAMESHYYGVGRSWSPIDDRFITTSFDGDARIWDATSGEALLNFEGHAGKAVTGADWSPDGKRIVTSCGDGDALVWDPDSGEVLMALDVEEGSWTTRAAWSPDGKRIATYSDDSTGGRIWDASSGELLLTFSGHTASVFGLDWSATGERLLTVSNDGTARIWDTNTGAELLSYSFGQTLTEGAWSPDNKHIALSAADGKVRIVDVLWNTTDELIAYARQCCLMRPLTADERELFGLPPR